MKRVPIYAVASVGLLLVAISVYAMWGRGQTETASSPATKPNAEAFRAVNIIRVINTAEVVTCRTKDGSIDENAKFLSWDELLIAPCFKQAQGQFSGVRFSQASELSFSPGSEIVPGLELRLVVSPDGRQYNLWLGQKRDVHCGFAFFSDERGVIYEGQAIGCNSQGLLGKP
jgi:hypothetical protein